MLIKKIVFFGIIIIALIIINDLANSIFNLLQKNVLLDQRQHVLSIERKKNMELKKKIKIVTAPQFIEEEARNKLFLVKPGEGIVMGAPTVILEASTAGAKHINTKPNWQQWWETFF